MISDDGLEYWLKHIINNVDGGIFAVINQAVLMAIRNHPDELKQQRGKIMEKLFSYGEQHHISSSGFNTFNKAVEEEENQIQNMSNMNYNIEHDEIVDQQSSCGDNEKILATLLKENNLILSPMKDDDHLKKKMVAEIVEKNLLMRNSKIVQVPMSDSCQPIKVKEEENVTRTSKIVQVPMSYPCRPIIPMRAVKEENVKYDDYWQRKVAPWRQLYDDYWQREVAAAKRAVNNNTTCAVIEGCKTTGKKPRRIVRVKRRLKSKSQHNFIVNCTLL
ncbi:hypothetical protein FRX31_027477 [Thalictrum thalictroides]|uniref:Uncharacterized protein n=1 Tax=Thalictrum thalictroides TaxID=46969 RepID=A0A7J6VDF4_THATH|nr:hypothetical protein FRX31_027477 [Thalictrum thalictroides]